MREKELDYMNVLEALNDIPFSVGKKLLTDFIQGDASNETIKRNRLDKLQSFGSLAYEKDEITQMIDRLLLNNLIEQKTLEKNKFWKVLQLSEKGKNELKTPTLHKKKISHLFKEKETTITNQERELFNHLGNFISKYNDAQKKAIICNKEHILCLAGAGSGKTSVLTKRIEFLIKYRSVNQHKILGITFTRKARDEMMHRLSTTYECQNVHVETFNSFCERVLRTYNNIAYNTEMRVITYRDKMHIIRNALEAIGLNISRAISIYFSPVQIRSKTQEQLAHVLMNDCFFVRDYFKSKSRKLEKSAFETIDARHEQSAEMMFSVCRYIEGYMQRNGLRDFTDQLLDAIALFRLHPELIPEYEHVLIDEFQDINATQVELVDLLNPKNIFCVGDPRQSIYGWRGSDIKYILNFEDTYNDAEIITLKKNYRSSEKIVNLINASIKNMGLADLESGNTDDNKILHTPTNASVELVSCKNELAETFFVIKKIKESSIPRKEIFVLARTNKQLKNLSEMLVQEHIAHVLRTDETRKKVYVKENELTLATIHAIKGLEAEMVFVIGATPANFPCKASDHPVIDMIKVDEYDKEEEERRLFYVAMSRAKKILYVTYSTKTPTHYITKEMLDMLDQKKNSYLAETLADQVVYKPNKSIITGSGKVIERLKQWRWQRSQSLGLPAYMILSNKALIDLAQKTPLTKKDLYDVYGLGPNKVMKYGEEILEILHG